MLIDKGLMDEARRGAIAQTVNGCAAHSSPENLPTRRTYYQLYCAHLKRNVMREKTGIRRRCKKQNAKHNMEKLSEKKQQHCSSMMSLREAA
jgi:hypothetical protein